VLGITKGNVTAEIPLDIGTGLIRAVIARTAAEEMGLAVGIGSPRCSGRSPSFWQRGTGSCR
jgi:hypothetical protein